MKLPPVLQRAASAARTRRAASVLLLFLPLLLVAIAVAWRSGIRVCQTRVFGPQLFEVPGTRGHGLARENVGSGGNDRQLQMTYTAQEREQLRALAA